MKIRILYALIIALIAIDGSIVVQRLTSDRALNSTSDEITAVVLNSVLDETPSVNEQAAEPTNSRPPAVRAKFAADFSNNEILVGASHHIFVGKVLKIRGTEKISGDPFSHIQFDVKILSNIKGSLSGMIVADQMKIAGGEDFTPFLQVGHTYLMVTRYYEPNNWHVVHQHRSGLKIISTDDKLSESELTTLAEKDARVNDLRIAYPNEILIRADISHNNTPNSFISLPTAEQDRLKAEAEQLKAQMQK